MFISKTARISTLVKIISIINENLTPYSAGRTGLHYKIDDNVAIGRKLPKTKAAGANENILQETVDANLQIFRTKQINL